MISLEKAVRLRSLSAKISAAARSMRDAIDGDSMCLECFSSLPKMDKDKYDKYMEKMTRLCQEFLREAEGADRL